MAATRITGSRTPILAAEAGCRARCVSRFVVLHGLSATCHQHSEQRAQHHRPHAQAWHFRERDGRLDDWCHVRRDHITLPVPSASAVLVTVR